MERKMILGIFLIGIVGIFGCGCIDVDVTVPTTPEPVTPTPEPVMPDPVILRPDPVNVTFEGYYESGCQLPADMTMGEYLTSEWETPYKEDGWDCSQMSAYTEWFVENCGFDAVIFVSIGHAWVGIDIDRDGRLYEYEATGCFWITPEDIEADEDMYTVHHVYEDIYEVQEDYYYDTELFYSEWGWWLA